MADVSVSSKWLCLVFPLSLLLLLGSPAVAAAASASPLNICGTNATVGGWVISSFNLSYPGLEAVAEAAHKGDLNEACELIAQYYKTSASGAWMRVPAPPPSSKRTGGRADDALNDVFWLSGVDFEAHVPRNPDGGLDWYYTGPRKDPECMNCINRFPFFGDLIGNGYLKTGNEIYAAKAGDLITDWVLHLVCHPCKTSSSESPWRRLEQGIRMSDPWPSSFYALQNASAFNTTARVLLLFGVSEHGTTLSRESQAGDGQVGAANWLMEEYTGLVNLALAFPELANSQQWLDVGLQGITHELENDVYPDGIETEQASGYDIMSADNFFHVLTLLKTIGRETPASFHNGVEQMFNYAAYCVDQHGYLPRDGDADYEQPWPGLQDALAFFNRSDWQYVVSGGAAGTPPQGPPTVLFPYGGQFIMRSGWHPEDQWAFFDVGPYGSSGHAHRDKLHINIRANGSQLLVDSGRFAYNGENATWHSEYAPTTRAHNTLTLDGCSQVNSPATVSQPVANDTYSISDSYDTARARMSEWDGLAGAANHTRALLYRRGAYWLVVDVVDTDRPRQVQATWHVHPDAGLVAEKLGAGVGPVRANVTGVPATMSLALVPEAGSPWVNASIVKGLQPPEAPYQGWYSRNYTDCRPAPVLIYDAAVPAGRSLAAWLLVPAAGAAPPGDAALRLVRQNVTHAVFHVSPGAGAATVEETVNIGPC